MVLAANSVRFEPTRTGTFCEMAIARGSSPWNGRKLPSTIGAQPRPMPPPGAPPPAFCWRSRTARVAAFAAAISWRYGTFWISSTCDGWIFNCASTSAASSLAAFGSPKLVSDPLCTAAL